MAGETPDRSKQRKSSGPASGEPSSATSDPRLTVRRDRPAGQSADRPAATDRPTAVFRMPRTDAPDAAGPDAGVTRTDAPEPPEPGGEPSAAVSAPRAPGDDVPEAPEGPADAPGASGTDPGASEPSAAPDAPPSAAEPTPAAGNVPSAELPAAVDPVGAPASGAGAPGVDTPAEAKGPEDRAEPAAPESSEDSAGPASPAGEGTGGTAARPETPPARNARLRDAVAAWVATADEEPADKESAGEKRADGVTRTEDAPAADTPGPEKSNGRKATVKDPAVAPAAAAGPEGTAPAPGDSASGDPDSGVPAVPSDSTAPAEPVSDEKPLAADADAGKTDAGKTDAGKTDGGKTDAAKPAGSGAAAGADRPTETFRPVKPAPPERDVERTSTFVPLKSLDDARPAAGSRPGPQPGTKTGGAKTGGTKSGGTKSGGTSPASPAKERPGALPAASAPPKPASVPPKSAVPAEMPAASAPSKRASAPSKPASASSKPASAPPKSAVPAEMPPAVAVGASADAATADIPEAERTRQQPLPPRPPLDLLAELTNTPPPPETPVRTAVRRVKIWTPILLLLLIVFAIVQAVRPLPSPTLALTADGTYAFEGDEPALPWPGEGQGWMDVDGLGTVDSFGEQKAVPIGSVAKAMTAYVVLQEHPLEKGKDGPMIKVDPKAAEEGGYDAQGESTLNTVQAGDKLSQKDALSAIMIPSANNVARLLARWDAGSEKAFVAKMNAAAEELGMKNTKYTDPSGLNATTVSSAEDQVKLGNALVKIPALMAITAQPTWTDPSGQTWQNYNRLVPYNNAIGIKTGSTTKAGGNLLFAATQEVGGETVTVVGAILGQHKPPIIDTVNAVSKTAMIATQELLESEKVVKKGDVVGYVDDGLGGRTPVIATKDVTAVGWPGLTVKLDLTDEGKAIPHAAEAGTPVGVLTVGDGSGDAVEVPVALQEDLTEPGFTEKLTRLG